MRDVTINGAPLDLEKTYTLALTDFMLHGGDGYEMFAGQSSAGRARGRDTDRDGGREGRNGPTTSIRRSTGGSRLSHSAGRAGQARVAGQAGRERRPEL